MGRIRTIKPEFFINEELFDLEQETGLPIRVAFAGLWCQADREGRFKWKPRTLKATILPHDDVDFSRVLHALTTRGFVQKYTVESVDFGVIPGFARHQVINNKERASDLPKPTENKDLTREPRVSNAKSTREERVTQGREGKGTSKAHPDGYAFEGDTIRITHKDFDEMQAKYSRVDLSHQLGQLDLELRGKKNWWVELNSKLNYRNNAPAYQRKSVAGEPAI